jgi:hypothetical protein
VDDIVSPQIPDPVTQPLLYETVTKNMVHGPCGPGKPSTRSMVNNVCSKHYPKTFREETLYGDDGYSEYARPDNGLVFTDRSDNVHDNRDIVPHNPYLCAKYGVFASFFLCILHLNAHICVDCHINVEICASVKAIKYIHKYIYIKAMTTQLLKSQGRVLRPLMRSKTMWMLAIFLP